MDTADDTAYQLMLRLRAVRSFAPEPLDGRHLEMILEAARWTGSAKNRQAWSFVVLEDADAKQRVAATGDFTTPLVAAPVAIAIVQEPDGYEFDTGRVAQNLMLAAAAIGVASCPVTLHRDQDAATALGIPSGSRCRYAIALGYPGVEAAASGFGGRKPLHELVHRNHYR
jgi:nitroreductase